MNHNYLKICVILLIPHCHGSILDLIGFGNSRPERGLILKTWIFYSILLQGLGIFRKGGGVYLGNNVPERGECAHWGSVNPYAAPFMTDTGELFNRNDLIAAHRTLPIGSYATVTNTLNMHSVVVRITAKGPFSEGRTMELSPAAFSQIADISEAIIPCSISTKGSTGTPPSLSLPQHGGVPNVPGYPSTGYPTQSGYPQSGYQNQPNYAETGYGSQPGYQRPGNPTQSGHNYS